MNLRTIISSHIKSLSRQLRALRAQMIQTTMTKSFMNPCFLALSHFKMCWLSKRRRKSTGFQRQTLKNLLCSATSWVIYSESTWIRMRSNPICLEDLTRSLKLVADPLKKYSTKKTWTMKGKLRYSQSIKKYIVLLVSYKDLKDYMRGLTYPTRTNSGSATPHPTCMWGSRENCHRSRVKMSRCWTTRQPTSWGSSTSGGASKRTSLKSESGMSSSRISTKNSCRPMQMTSSHSIPHSRTRKAPRMRRSASIKRMQMTSSGG